MAFPTTAPLRNPQGDLTAKGYSRDSMVEVFRRYIPRSEVEAMFSRPPDVESELQPDSLLTGPLFVP